MKNATRKPAKKAAKKTAKKRAKKALKASSKWLAIPGKGVKMRKVRRNGKEILEFK